jgi:hypothetical protein
VGFGGEEKGVDERTGAFGPQANLSHRFLGRHVQNRVAAHRNLPCDIEKQRRFSDPGFTGQEDCGTGDNSAAQNSVELGDAGGTVLGVRDGDLSDGYRGPIRGDARRDRSPAR